MNDNRSHPLLAQVPLQVSPFVSLPTATTLPYTYKTLPSTLPPSSTQAAATSTDGNAQYVVSASGHAAHPSEILASCQALKAYIQKVQDDADRELKTWEEAIQVRDLAEKRRLAPGWLDSDARILEPEKSSKGGGEQKDLMDDQVSSADASVMSQIPVNLPNGEGDELDRAFGGLSVSNTQS